MNYQTESTGVYTFLPNRIFYIICEETRRNIVDFVSHFCKKKKTK